MPDRIHTTKGMIDLPSGIESDCLRSLEKPDEFPLSETGKAYLMWLVKREKDLREASIDIEHPGKTFLVCS